MYAHFRDYKPAGNSMVCPFRAGLNWRTNTITS